MKVEVKYSRLGCLWNFVETLTLYHFSYNQGDVKNWLSWTGGDLSEEEKISLKDLSKIADKINQGQKGIKGTSWRLDQAFSADSEKEVWKKVSVLANPEELLIIKKVVALLQPRFDQLWPEESGRLLARQVVLEQGFNSATSDEIVRILTTFFKASKVPDKVEIFLLLNTNPGGTQGGANLAANQISLHCSHSEPITYERFAGIIWHEIAHLFQQDHYYKLENKFVGEIKKPKFWEKRSPGEDSVIREAVVAAMAHFGYIDHRFLREDLDKLWARDFAEKWRYGPQEFNSWGFYSSYHLQPLVEKYVSTERGLDDEFMNELLRLWSEYQKFCLDYLGK